MRIPDTPEEADDLYRLMRSQPVEHPCEGLAKALADALNTVDSQELRIEELERAVAAMQNDDLDQLKVDLSELQTRFRRQSTALRNLYNAIPEAKTVAARKALQQRHLKDLNI
jgi:uncharacterized coiled-coil protein SlyX